MIEINSLSVIYKAGKKDEEIGIQDLSLNIYQNEILGIVGESGSGKSTLVNSILQTLPADATKSGRIKYRDSEINDKNILKLYGRKIAYIPQNFSNSLSKYFKIKNQYNFFPAKNESDNSRQYKRDILAKIKSLCIPKNNLEKYIFELAGGQKQRIIISMSLLNNPEIILADEPASAIDAVSKRKFIDLILDYKNKSKKNVTIVIVSHDLPLILNVCDRIAVMKDGCLLEMGKKGQVGHHPYTELLLRSKPTLETKELYQAKEFKNRESKSCQFSKNCEYYTKRCLEFSLENYNDSHFCRCVNVTKIKKLRKKI